MKISKAKQEVIDVSDLIQPHFTQIVIDLFQEDLIDLIDDEEINPDKVGAFHYYVDCLLDVFNIEFEKDIQLLHKLKVALNGWEDDLTFVNKSLGLDPNQ